jgi:hypothetical protein
MKTLTVFDPKAPMMSLSASWESLAPGRARLSAKSQAKMCQLVTASHQVGENPLRIAQAS